KTHRDRERTCIGVLDERILNRIPVRIAEHRCDLEGPRWQDQSALPHERQLQGVLQFRVVGKRRAGDNGWRGSHRRNGRRYYRRYISLSRRLRFKIADALL